MSARKWSSSASRLTGSTSAAAPPAGVRPSRVGLRAVVGGLHAVVGGLRGRGGGLRGGGGSDRGHTPRSQLGRKQALGPDPTGGSAAASRRDLNDSAGRGRFL